MDRRTYGKIAASFVSASALTAIATAEGASNSSAVSEAGDRQCGANVTATPTASDAPITILEQELVEDPFGNAEVEGTLKNTSGEFQDYIEVEAVFFDADGVRSGDTFGNMTDVPPDQEARFETVFSTTEYDEVDCYELTVKTTPF